VYEYEPIVFLENIFEKKIAPLNSLTLSVRLSVCPFFSLSVRLYPIFSPSFNLRSSNWILREDYPSTRTRAGFFDPEPRSSGIVLILGPFQIKVFSLYFINFWETINHFQLTSQGYNKIQIFQKKFFLGSIGSSW
jgi:hypothetical protein